MLKKIMTINEKDYIERILNDDLYMITDKPKATVDLLAQYYYQIKTIRKKGIADKLIAFLADRYPKYPDNKKFWNSYAEKTAKKTGGNKLLICDGIHITKSELAKINEIESIPDLSGVDKKTLQRLLFTILVIGKYQKLKNPKNINGYINIKTIYLFQLARVKGNAEARSLMLNDLYRAGLIDFPKNYAKDNCRPTFIDEETTDTRITITDLREIGYQYNKLHGDNLIACHNCGVLIKTNSGKANGLCQNCAERAKQKICRCVDCNRLFTRGIRAAIKTRCNSCQIKHNKAVKKAWNEGQKEKCA